MIKFAIASRQPIENDEYWSYPIEELGHIFENAESDMTYLYYEGRLYEAPYLNKDECDYIIKEA